MRAYLFDLDGTLVASEPLKAQALAAACASYGATVEPAIYAEVMGEDWATVTRHFFEQGGLAPDWRDFNERFREAYLALIESELVATPGALAFVGESAARGLRVGLVSSAASWMVETILARIGGPRFDPVITQEQVTRHKPDPSAYRLALAALDIDPAEALVFEDSSAGLQAATGAGCPCVAIRHGYNARHDLSASILTIHSFEELLGGTSRLPATFRRERPRAGSAA